MAIYAVQFMYADRSARDRARPHHRAYLQSQLEAGKLVKSGPYVDDSGALLIYEVDTEAELQEKASGVDAGRAGSRREMRLSSARPPLSGSIGALVIAAWIRRGLSGWMSP